MTKYIIIALFVLSGGILAFHYYQKAQYDKKIVALQNQIAENEKTIQVTKDLFEKGAVQTKNLSDLLDSKNTENAELLKQIDKQKGTILTLTSVVVKYKATSGSIKLVAASQPSSFSSSQPSSMQVCFENPSLDFSQKLGRYNVNGNVNLSSLALQLHIDEDPLQISLSVYQTKDKAWHSIVQTGDNNVSADITISGVNPYVLEPKWYQRIGFSGSLGVGSTSGGAGLLTGLGINYQFDKFEVGPNVWLLINDKTATFWGLGLTWHPF
jgi:hypothetical protein